MNEFNQNLPFVLAPTLNVINQLVSEGIIEKYVIGGSVAILYYSEVFGTDDVDLFCHLRQDTLLFSLAPVYKRLEELGSTFSGLYASVKGVRLQFLSPDSPLEKEAFDTAVTIEIEDVCTHIFQLEYAMAVKVAVGRPKDWIHISAAMESANPDLNKLKDILKKFDLLDKWGKYYP